MDIKIVKVADIVLNNEVVDIEGKVREEAFVFENHYSAEKTEKIINKLKEKELVIDRKLQTRGYFFNDEIDNVSIEPEVIVYLLNHCLNKNLEFGDELGQMGKAVYFDEDYARRDARELSQMAEDLYNQHYYKKK